MTFALWLLGAYLLGALPIGLYVGKIARGVDVRDLGSGNTGATNVWRTLGPGLGLLVFILDVAKGIVPVLLAKYYAPLSGWGGVLAGFAAIIGHNVSPFLKFKGGKGVATTLGVGFGLSWQAALIGFAVWGVCLALTRYVSVASIVGTVVGAVSLWLLNHQQIPSGLFALIAAVFVIVKHRPNITRLRAGTEPKVGKKV